MAACEDVNFRGTPLPSPVPTSSPSHIPTPLPTVIVIGAAGVIGKRLLQELKKRKYKIVAALRRTPLPDNILSNEFGNQASQVICEFGVDLRNSYSIDQLIEKYCKELCVVCNFAAPLSVESEKDPSSAQDTTVGGMRRLIEAMDKNNVPKSVKVLFSDSIGSYGSWSPRLDVDARWLTLPENQHQDPGSEYGKQKKQCREILSSSKYDTRWGIIPGVLHDDPTWGDGTTEYALEAMATFSNAYQKHINNTQSSISTYTCPIRESSMLPMIHISDLIVGLVSLMEADRAALQEPDNGYAFAGFSFTPSELFLGLESHLREKYNTPLEEAVMEVDFDPSGPAAVFADLWPDSISGEAALRDLQWAPSRVPTLQDAIKRIVSSHH